MARTPEERLQLFRRSLSATDRCSLVMTHLRRALGFYVLTPEQQGLLHRILGALTPDYYEEKRDPKVMERIQPLLDEARRVFDKKAFTEIFSLYGQRIPDKA